jgi:hypothetical protein
MVSSSPIPDRHFAINHHPRRNEQPLTVPVGASETAATKTLRHPRDRCNMAGLRQTTMC